MTSKEQGEALQKLAYAEPPIVPEDLAQALIGVCLAFAGIATIIIALRIYVRGWLLKAITNWGWEDTFAVLSYGAFISSTIFAVKAAYYGLGTPDSKLNDFLMVRCAEYMLYSQVTYGISMPLVKASVVFMLLRITPERKYRWSLYAMLFITTVMAIVGILASLTYCTPVKAYWNPLLGKCGDFNRVVTIGYVWTAVGIVTDWWCAILPFFIVRKLQMSRRAKRTVLLIMGLGAIASTATIVRAPYLQYYLATKDKLYWNGHISIWCQLESGLGIIAASLPSLRKLFNKYFDLSRNASGAVSGGKSSSADVIRTIGGGVTSGTPLESLNSSGKGMKSNSSMGGSWRRLEDESSSSKGIIDDHIGYVETGSLSDSDTKHPPQGLYRV